MKSKKLTFTESLMLVAEMDSLLVSKYGTNCSDLQLIVFEKR